MTLSLVPSPVFVDGRLLSGSEPAIPAHDLGYLLGLAVFDTVLFEQGCLYFLEDHVARLRRSAQGLAIPWPPPWDPAEALRETARALAGKEAALRITLSRGVPGRGPSLVITPRLPEQPDDPGVAVWISRLRKLGGDPLESLKTTNRIRNVLAREEAQAHGAWEALLLNDAGDVSEATVSNVFARVGGALVTPPTERGSLAGITREKLLEDLEREPLVLEGAQIPVEVRRLDRAELERADEVFLTNTTARIAPVTAVEGEGRPRVRLPGSLGPVTALCRERFRSVEERYRSRAAGGDSMGAHERPGGRP